MSTHLLIDAGNSRIKWRLVANGTERTGVVLTSLITSDPSALIDLKKIAAACELQITASVVAGKPVQDALLAAVHPQPIHFVCSTASACGLINQYTQPSQLGSDRFAALIAAHHLHTTTGTAPSHRARTKLVVMAGTAITIDALTADGIFLGGVILPGLATMQIALGQHTALLPAYQPASGAVAGPVTFARDTRSAIQTGAVDAAVGAILENIRRLQRAVPANIESNIEIVASGGDISAIAHAISPPMSIPLTIIDDLVIRGLHLIAQQQN